MGDFCNHCKKKMKNSKATHCSDECLLAYIKKSQSVNKESKGVETWGEDTDPWT